jgi:hypothetical protein
MVTIDTHDTCGNPITEVDRGYFYLKLGIYEDKRDTAVQSIAYDDYKHYRE